MSTCASFPTPSTTQDPAPAGPNRATSPEAIAPVQGGSPVFCAIDELLRDPSSVLQRITDGRDLTTLAKATILTIAFGAGVFGAAMGTFRGGFQILYAGVKLPIVLLLTMAICAPALTAINRAVGRNGCLRRDLALVLSALARASLVLAAQAPLVLLAVRGDASYHLVVLLVVICCAVAGATGLSLFLRGLRARQPEGRWVVVPALFLVFSLVGTQMSWTLRPFLLRPRTPEIVFVRAVEGSFFEAVAVSLQSARGVYSRDYAPLPGENWEAEP